MKSLVSGCAQNRINDRRILHLDMDAFYVSVELLKRPELRGSPVIIGGKSPRGVVSTCSYTARRYGVHSGMASVKAMRLCPDAVWLNCDFTAYNYYSEKVFSIMRRYSPEVYPLSVDEGRVDLTGSEALFGSAAGIANRIVREIRDELGLPASAGLANSGVTAKIAAEMAKPFGLIVVFPGKEKAFLAPVPIQKIPGVGKVSLPKFHTYGYRTIGDLAAESPDILAHRFGPWAESLYRTATGVPKIARPSIPVSPGRSNEITFSHDITDTEHIRSELRRLVEKLGFRLRKSNITARTVTVKIRDAGYRTITRSKTFDTPTNRDHILFQIAEQLVLSNRPGHSGIRLLGISVQNLRTRIEQPLLFESTADRQYGKLYSTVDTIKEKYGKQTVFFGSAHLSRINRNNDKKRYFQSV
jgi:DNA polymerase IV